MLQAHSAHPVLLSNWVMDAVSKQQPLLPLPEDYICQPRVDAPESAPQ